MRAHPFTYVGIVACGSWWVLSGTPAKCRACLADHRCACIGPPGCLAAGFYADHCGLCPETPKAAPATRLTVDFGAVGQASASAEADITFLCSGPGGSVYGPTSQPVDCVPSKGFIACLRATKVLLAWPHIFRGHRQWNVADARASHRYGDFARYAQHFACSMFQPSTSFLVGCAMVACLVSERGALLRGFSAGSYSCTVAAIVWRHLLGRDSRLHVRIGGVSMPPPCLRGLAQSAGDYALESVKIIQVTTDTSCPWSSVGESGVRAALNAEGIGVLAVHDDRRIFGVNGHNYSHLVKILDGAGPSLHSAFARSDDLYYQWAGFDPRSAENLQHIALALACQEPRELVRVTDRPQIPRMISDASWLAAAAGERLGTRRTHGCRSLHGLMDLPAYRATAPLNMFMIG